MLFSSKRRVVFTKMTCCFHQNDVLFSMNILMWENSITKRKPIAKIPKCKNTYNLRVTRARIRDIQEFLCFCCHKCHTVICIILFFRLLRDYLWYILTNKRFNRGKYAGEDNEIGHFFRLNSSQNCRFSTNFFSVCDTCDSKKTTSLLEDARTYAYALA